jgi:hypothetical protein
MFQMHDLRCCFLECFWEPSTIRDRPFNLKGEGGLWFFVSFRIFFSDNTRVRILFFLSRKAHIFFSESNIRLYDKNSESDYFVSSTKIRIFFSATLGIRIFFLEKKHYPPPLPLQVKWSFPYLLENKYLKDVLISQIFDCSFVLFNWWCLTTLSTIFQLYGGG